MYFRQGDGWEPPPPWQPPRRSRLTRRQQRVMLWLIGLNVFLLLVAPIGGATIIQAVAALFGR